MNINSYFTVPCAVGTYYDKDTHTCTPCAQGFYQSEAGQLQCTQCPVIAGRSGVTVGLGARSAADCKGSLSRSPFIFYKGENLLQNAVRLENITTTMPVFAEVVDMVFTNRKRDHSPVKYVVSGKLQEPTKLFQPKNVAMNAEMVCSWPTTENVNHVHVVLTEHKEFNRHVKGVRLEEQLQKLEQLPLKNVLYLCVIQAPT